jgi:hypothetical protein
MRNGSDGKTSSKEAQMIIEAEKTNKAETEKAKGKGRVKKLLSLIEKNLPTAQKSAKPKPSVAIDYPANGEKIQPHQYSVRIGAGGAESVELAVDKGDWQNCRQSAGYWWYDWHSIPKGKHKITARIKLPNGKVKKSATVRCIVE